MSKKLKKAKTELELPGYKKSNIEDRNSTVKMFCTKFNTIKKVHSFSFIHFLVKYFFLSMQDKKVLRKTMFPVLFILMEKLKIRWRIS